MLGVQKKIRRVRRGRVMHNKALGGFSLIELLVAMVVGLVIIGGALSLHVSSRKVQAKNEEQMDMVADARFVIGMISYDLRSAGMWGGTNNNALIECKSTDAVCTATASKDTPPTPAAVSGDCAVGWYYNLTYAVFATDGSVGNPYATTCIPSSQGYVAGTDILEVRYADSNRPAVLRAGQVYIRSNFVNGRVFIGATPPVLQKDEANPLTHNYILHDYAYYISNYSDSVGDGIPSLRRVSLVNGPALKNQMLVSGVADLQVQFGEDIDGIKDANGNLTIDRYENPQSVINWNHVYAAKIWLLMRSDKKQSGVDTTKSFSMAGASAKTYGGPGGYRYFMVTSVVDLRNLR